MQSDGLIPFAFGDKDGWPAMGTFDILNLRLNGYDFHVNLMAGKEKWTDPKVKTVFQKWAEILPFHQEDAAGRTWQDARRRSSRRRPGCTSSGMFASQQFAAAKPGGPRRSRLLPVPDLGHAIRRREGARRPDRRVHAQQGAEEPRRRQGVPRVPRPAPRPRSLMTADQSNIAAAKDADTSGYTPLQKKAAEIIGAAKRITQFLDRDTRPDFAGPNGMQGFLLKFLKDPNQDLAALQKTIQDFWDTLAAVSARRPTRRSEPWWRITRTSPPSSPPIGRDNGGAVSGPAATRRRYQPADRAGTSSRSA